MFLIIDKGSSAGLRLERGERVIRTLPITELLIRKTNLDGGLTIGGILHLTLR